MALKVVGSSPTTHPLGKVTFFQKNKIKKKFFKKKHHLIKLIHIYDIIKPIKLFRKILIYYNNLTKVYKINNIKFNNREIPISILLTQKVNNPKVTIWCGVNLNTFSVGSIIKYFKIKHNKCLRRSARGLKIFLNFLKNVFEKKYQPKKIKYILYSISGFDYSLLQNRKNIKYFFKKNICDDIYYIYNLKISFTKIKNKKIKSIKKRLKKKIIINFLKKTNI